MTEVGMNGISEQVRVPVQKKPDKKSPVVNLEMGKDAVEISQKPKTTVGGVLFAGSTAVYACPKAFDGGKKLVENGINKAENFIKKFLDDIASVADDAGKVVQEGADDIANATKKAFKGLPGKYKVIAAYAVGIITAVGTAFLIFKDTDKDGHLDLSEAARKLAKPEV